MNSSPVPRFAGGAAAPKGADLLLALLRIVIGWHFLYEGLAKLLTPNWSAEGFLLGSTGPMAAPFHALASHSAALSVVNHLNIWGLLLVGAGLMLGLGTRVAAGAGMLFLALYYAASPPLFLPPVSAREGSYLLVDRNLVELLALAVTLFLPARRFGLDGLIFRPRAAAAPAAPAPAAPDEPRAIPPAPAEGSSRRKFLTALTGLPFAGVFALTALRRYRWQSTEERRLADAFSGATIKATNAKRLEELKGLVPQGRIGSLNISRMILGGNLIGGWAHARDLLYVSPLIKAYHNRPKIFETFSLAEACGVNSFLIGPALCPVVNDYKRCTGGKMQFISACGSRGDLEGDILRSVDLGVCACYVQGETGDAMVAKGEFDRIAKSLELIRRNGLPAGIGGHTLPAIKECRDRGIRADFWVKSLHHGNYWSSFHGGENEYDYKHDHFWCWHPEDVIAYMKDVTEPWIAFKTLAAGAILPKDGFHYAFENGADFICVGAYDFQMVETMNCALEVLGGQLRRHRKWCG